MSEKVAEATRMLSMLPEQELDFACEMIRKILIAWDPDYVKVTPEEAAAREVREETGLTAESVKYIDSCFYDGRDQLMLGMLARVKKAECHISGELLEAKWFSFDEAVKTVREGSIIQRFIKSVRKEMKK